MPLGSKIGKEELPASNVLRATEVNGTLIVPITAWGQVEFNGQNGQKRVQRTINVTVNKEDKNCVVGGDNLPGLVKEFGDDMAKWIGKKVVISQKSKINPVTKAQVVGLLIVPGPKE